ncbi:Putative N-acetylmannosamine-6-phosphate 2-epimerase [Serratia odorifera]|uniref:N-acylglucosamine-6-phosphate 2-epimerase n=1 Tax=Serratia odorifera TaxID=618 RepID=A0A3S4E781_SEROD|nr:Putative N-acetylmannosamine-6-phosphate 2-epimerase [Serratia odorifera]
MKLMCLSPQMIAMDATAHPRPGGLSLAELVQAIRSKYPRLLLMADIATLAEAIQCRYARL